MFLDQYNYAFTHLTFNLIFFFFIKKTYFILNKLQSDRKKDILEVLCKSMQISRIRFKNKISHNYRRMFTNISYDVRMIRNVK